MDNNSNGLVASVIIPVYNKEQFLDVCLKTLEEQTLDHNKFEAIFIDDGSEDKSLSILEKFAENHPWAIVVHQENGGVCSARNKGIDLARGKYLFYLDPDDEISPNTLADISNFFDQHYDEVDLVTYIIKPVINGVKQESMFRYRLLTSTGVYKLDELNNHFITQTTMNVCVKNLFAENRHFDFETTNGIIYHEDQQYITEILLDKNTIGFVNTCEYLWNKNAESVTNTIVRPYYIFENTLRMYEKLFGAYEGAVPKYLQAMYVHDLAWKTRHGVSLPNHLEGEEYEKAIGRMGDLLERVDDEILLTHPNINPHHALFLMGLRKSSKPQAYIGPGGVSIISKGATVRADKKLEVYLLKSRAHDTSFDIIGIIKSPIFKFSNPDVHVFARLADESGVVFEELELEESGDSYYLSDYKVAEFKSFRYSIPLDRECTFSPMVTVNGMIIPTSLTRNQNRINFTDPLINTVPFGDKFIVLNAKQNSIEVKDRTRSLDRSHQSNLRHGLDLPVYLVRVAIERLSSYLHKKYREVWIYTDAPHLLGNAWLQYIHDAHKNDGVMRYYVASGVDTPDAPEGDSCKVIEFGSKLHKIVHWAADKRLLSDVSQSCITPWDDKARRFYADYDNAEKVYLQHGVLWAHMPWYYSHDKVLIDREVVSTQFEVDNLTKNYGFKESDLIKSGMARYDQIDHEQPAEKKVLLCPSWRSYLVGALTSEGRKPTERIFLASQYYKNLNALVHNERLVEVLKKHGYQLDLKLHPNFACYSHLFRGVKNPIKVVDHVEHESSYAVIITDYSSYSFDFVYLNRAIIYYIPDEEMFRAGVSNYSSLDMDLEDAMGEYAKSPDEVIDALESILDHDGKPWGRFEEKEQGFFLYYDNGQRERIYQALLEPGH